jgi:RNA recognition motif-containing protein
LKSARLPKDIYTEKHRGYAFITYEDIESAKKTLKEAVIVDGKEVKVEFAKEGPKKRETKPIRYDPPPRDYQYDVRFIVLISGSQVFS